MVVGGVGSIPTALILHLQSAGAFFVPKIMKGGVGDMP